MEHFITPHGGALVTLLADADRAETLKTESQNFPSLTLSQRQVCDLELLMNGAFSPLTGFMGEAVYESVLDDMRLPDGSVWPVPVVLDVPEKFAEKLEKGEKRNSPVLENGKNRGFYLNQPTCSNFGGLFCRNGVMP